jgi:hypothetical protein
MSRMKLLKFDILFVLIIFTVSIFLFYPKGLILENFYGSGDETTYKKLAIKLVTEKIYAEDFDNLRSWRPPGYPFYLSFFYFFFGDIGFKIVPYINFIFYNISFYILFNISNLFFKKNYSFIFVLTAFLFNFYKFNEILVINYSETLYFFLICFFLFFLLRSFLKKEKFSFILSFFILGISCMVRGPSLPFGIILIFFILFFDKTFSKKIILLSFFLFLIPSVTWIVRNYYILGFGPHLYTANYILLYYGLFNLLDAGKIDEMVRGLDDLEKINTLKPLILQTIQEDYIGTLVHFFRKVIKHIYYHNTYITSFILLFFLIYTYFKDKKNLHSLINSKYVKIFYLCICFSIIFIMINSLAQFSWRHSLIPSIIKILFEIFLIFYSIKYKSYVFFKSIKS